MEKQRKPRASRSVAVEPATELVVEVEVGSGPTIVKQNENGIPCLFDTRSGKFYWNGCVRKLEDQLYISELANSIIKKAPKSIYAIVQAGVYDLDNGYLNYMIARGYLELNPDIKEQALKALEKIKLRKLKKEHSKKEKKDNEKNKRRGTRETSSKV